MPSVLSHPRRTFIYRHDSIYAYSYDGKRQRLLFEAVFGENEYYYELYPENLGTVITDARHAGYIKCVYDVYCELQSRRHTFTPTIKNINRIGCYFILIRSKGAIMIQFDMVRRVNSKNMLITQVPVKRNYETSYNATNDAETDDITTTNITTANNANVEDTVSTKTSQVQETQQFDNSPSSKTCDDITEFIREIGDKTITKVSQTQSKSNDDAILSDASMDMICRALGTPISQIPVIATAQTPEITTAQIPVIATTQTSNEVAELRETINRLEQQNRELIDANETYIANLETERKRCENAKSVLMQDCNALHNEISKLKLQLGIAGESSNELQQQLNQEIQKSNAYSTLNRVLENENKMLEQQVKRVKK